MENMIKIKASQPRKATMPKKSQTQAEAEKTIEEFRQSLIKDGMTEAQADEYIGVIRCICTESINQLFREKGIYGA